MLSVTAYKSLGSGLFPFNPDRVLADTPQPPTILTCPKVDEVREGHSPQYEALPTPATPKSAESLTLLLNMIKQVPDNGTTSRQHKERLQQKVTAAAQTFLATNALLEERNHFLTNINDEGKVRRSSKSEIIGKARVMSYEDLEKARAERAMKEAAKEAKRVAKEAKEGAEKVQKVTAASKRKDVQKRKSTEEARALESDARITRMCGVQLENDTPPKQWRAPVAQMW